MEGGPTGNPCLISLLLVTCISLSPASLSAGRPFSIKNGSARSEQPLLAIDTEVNGDSKSTNVRGLPCLVPWACRAGVPVQDIFVLPWLP